MGESPILKKEPKWLVTDPDGLEYFVINLKSFCREHSLPYLNMINYAYRIMNLPFTNGWQCERLGEKGEHVLEVRERALSKWRNFQNLSAEERAERVAKSTLAITVTFRSSKEITEN